MNLLQLVKKELDDKGIYQFPFLTERLCASIGCHLLNQSNLENKRFYHMGSIDDTRLHVGTECPSGFGKSMITKFFLKPRSGLLAETEDLPTSVRATFTPESWAGTTVKTGDKVELTKGIFKRFKNGIVGADEFMRLKLLAESEVTTNEEAFLLTALGSDVATKDTSYDSIEIEDIGTTIWPGLRLTQLDTKSGLLRRFSFQLILPTPTEAKKIKLAVRSQKSKSSISIATKKRIARKIDAIRTNLREIKSVNLSEVEGFLNGCVGVPHFDELIYKRLALGYSIVTGHLTKVIMTPELMSLIRNEFWARQVIRVSPEKEAIYHVVLTEKDKMTREELKEFFKRYYLMTSQRFDVLFGTLARVDNLLYVHDNLVYAKERKVLEKYSI